MVGALTQDIALPNKKNKRSMRAVHQHHPRFVFCLLLV